MGKKSRLMFFLLMILATTGTPFLAHAHEGDKHKDQEALVYYNEACGMCATYVKTGLPEILKKQGVQNFVMNDYINEKTAREKMNELMSGAHYDVPLALRSHIMTFVGEKYVLAGHIPNHLVEEIFNRENSEKFKRIIVYQDEMHAEALDYQIYAIPAYGDNYVGEIKKYPIETPATEYLDYLEKNQKQFELDKKINSDYLKKKSLLPLVLVSGLLDGINPCAFAVLLFFIAFLFSMKRTRGNVWKMGLTYTLAIYLAYLLIGLGLMKAIFFIDSPHFMAKVGSWLVIILGVINLVNHLFPNFPLKLRIPHTSRETIEKWMLKSTVPAAFVLGFFVGLCTFPCSGGIYVAIIGLLALKATYWTGLGYLLLYNVMFVVPLIIILLFSSNKYSVEKLTVWEQSESKVMRLAAGLTMVILGVIILVWFT